MKPRLLVAPADPYGFPVLSHEETAPWDTYHHYPQYDDWFLGNQHIWEGSYEI